MQLPEAQPELEVGTGRVPWSVDRYYCIQLLSPAQGGADTAAV